MQTQKIKKKYDLRRNIALTFRVTAEERALIDERMKEIGIINRRHYLLKMALNGRIIRIECDSIRESTSQLSGISNNINQIARRVNQTGNIYEDDIRDIKIGLDKVWEQHRSIYDRLIKIHNILK